MSDYLINSIKNNYRKNIKYIYPVASNDELCRWISAFANNNGGHIVLGVADDGKKLKVKGFDFELKEDNIISKLGGDFSINIRKMSYEKLQLTYIEVQKADILITCNGTPYTLDADMKILELSIKKVFLSYCHNDKCIADIIEENLNKQTKGQVLISRDIRDIEYKDDIEKFMQTIEQHDFAITIVSDKYLKSRGCMYEISELMRNRKYFDKLLFVVLSASDKIYYDSTAEISDITADIYSINRFNYIKYWEAENEKINKLNSEITSIALKQGIVDEAKKIAIISQNIAEFLEKLNKSLGKSFDEMLMDNFADFLTSIFKPNAF